VNEAGARILLVTGSSPIQVNPEIEVCRRLALHLEVDSLMYPDDRLRGFAQDHNIPFLCYFPDCVNGQSMRGGVCMALTLLPHVQGTGMKTGIVWQLRLWQTGSVMMY